MALQANTINLRELVRGRLGTETFDSYLAELEVVEASADRVVVRVGPTLAREASRRCGPALAGVCRQLFGSRQVLLGGDGESIELGENTARGGQTREPQKPAEQRSSWSWPAAGASAVKSVRAAGDQGATGGAEGVPGAVRDRGEPAEGGQPGVRTS